jgi:hypothetical protein
MDLKIPGLSGALEKLDDLPDKMEGMTTRLDRVIEFLEETNTLLRRANK